MIDDGQVEVNPQTNQFAPSNRSELEPIMIDASWKDELNSPAENPAAKISVPEPDSEKQSFRIIQWLNNRKKNQEETENDSYRPSYVPEPPLKTGLKVAFAFFSSAVVAYLVLTAPSQFARAAYFIEHIGKKAEPAKIVKANVTTGKFNDVVQSTLTFRVPLEFKAVDNSSSSTDISIPEPFRDLGDNELIIPKIGVKSPIIWDSSWDEKTMLENLQKGVTHYGGTDFPNIDKGNVFITGHSSYYWWDKGNYKTIFALLPNLTSGDQMALTYEGKVYVYEMIESVTVKPSQVDVLTSTETPILSLMTCVPVGTSLNRLIVKSKLVGAFDRTNSTKVPNDTVEKVQKIEPTSSSSQSNSSSSHTPVQTEIPRDTINLLPGLD